MSKETAVILLGAWIVVVPQLGVPSPLRTTLLVISGVALIVLGFYLRSSAAPRTPRQNQSFVENMPDRQGAAPTSSSTQEKSVVTDSEHERKGITSLN